MEYDLRPLPANPHPADPNRKTALVAGILYLVTFAASIPAVLLLQPVLDDPSYITGTGPDNRVIAGASLDLVNALACVGTAVALFSVVRRQHEGLALGLVTTRMFEAAVIMIGVVSLLAVVTLRQTGAPGTNEAALIAVGQGLVAVRNWTFLLGPSLMPAFNALLLGSLLYRSGLVPRLIPAIGLVGAPLLIASTTATIFGITTATSPTAAIATLPIFLWELLVALWMTFKGFRPTAPILASMTARSAQRPLATNAAGSVSTG
jgi:hypothetical protein